MVKEQIPLRRVLRTFERERDNHHRRMATLEDQRATADTHMDGLRDRIDHLGARNPEHMDPSMFAVSRAANSRLRSELEFLDTQLDRFDNEVLNPARDRFRESSVRCRSIETLLERRHEAEREEGARARAKQMDEVASVRWLRERLRR